MVYAWCARLKVGKRSFHASPSCVQDVKMLEGGGSLPYRGARPNESFASDRGVYRPGLPWRAGWLSHRLVTRRPIYRVSTWCSVSMAQLSLYSRLRYTRLNLRRCKIRRAAETRTQVMPCRYERVCGVRTCTTVARTVSSARGWRPSSRIARKYAVVGRNRIAG